MPFFSKFPIDWTTNPDMMLEYKKLLSLRSSLPAARSGSPEQHSSFDVAAFTRKAGTNEIFVVVNVRNSQKTYNVPTNLQNISWKNGMTNENIVLGANLSLNAYEYRIFVK